MTHTKLSPVYLTGTAYCTLVFPYLSHAYQNRPFLLIFCQGGMQNCKLTQIGDFLVDEGHHVELLGVRAVRVPARPQGVVLRHRCRRRHPSSSLAQFFLAVDLTTYSPTNCAELSNLCRSGIANCLVDWMLFGVVLKICPIRDSLSRVRPSEKAMKGRRRQDG